MEIEGRLLEGNIDFIAHAISHWHALGVDAWIQSMYASKPDTRGAVFLLPHDKDGFILHPNDFESAGFENIIIRQWDNDVGDLQNWRQDIGIALRNLLSNINLEERKPLYIVGPMSIRVELLWLFRSRKVSTVYRPVFVLLDEGIGNYTSADVWQLAGRLDNLLRSVSYNQSLYYVSDFFPYVRQVAQIHERQARNLFHIEQGQLCLNEGIAKDYRNVMLQKYRRMFNKDFPDLEHPLAVVVTQPWSEYKQLTMEREMLVVKQVLHELLELGFHVVIKPHPRELRGKYAVLENSFHSGQVKVFDGQWPIEAIFTQMGRHDRVVGYTSTALITASSLFGIPSFTLCNRLMKESHGQMLEKGWLQFKSLTGRLISILNPSRTEHFYQMPDIVCKTDNKMPSPYASLIIPCFNKVEVTRKCVESIFENTDLPFEIILVDNGSTDDTAHYIESLMHTHPNVRHIKNDLNPGFVWAYNKGFSAATGKYLVTMRNDVTLRKGWLEGMVRAAEAPSIGIVGAWTNYIFDNEVQPSEEGASTGFFAKRADSSFMLIKREVIDVIGGFDSRFGQSNFADDDYCIRAQLAGFDIWIINNALVDRGYNRTFLGQIPDVQSVQDDFKILQAKWGLPSDWTFAQKIPYDIMLQRQYDKLTHYWPLSPGEIANNQVPAFPVAIIRSVHFLLAPDWRKGNLWLSGLEAFCTAFSANDDVELILRVDPEEQPDLNRVLTAIQRWAQQANIDLESGPDILILDDKIPPSQRAAIYRTSQVYLDFTHIAGFDFRKEEAEACGLRLCRPNVDEMRFIYTEVSQKVLTSLDSSLKASGDAG